MHTQTDLPRRPLYMSMYCRGVSFGKALTAAANQIRTAIRSIGWREREPVVYRVRQNRGRRM
jgi:hypothetical protein